MEELITWRKKVSIWAKYFNYHYKDLLRRVMGIIYEVVTYCSTSCFSQAVNVFMPLLWGRGGETSVLVWVFSRVKSHLKRVTFAVTQPIPMHPVAFVRKLSDEFTRSETCHINEFATPYNFHHSSYYH